MQMAADVEALKAKVKALEEALAAKVHGVEHATKDDIDAFLSRLRALEDKILGRKGK